MPEPREIVAQLLSPAQGEVLDVGGRAAWAAAADAIAAIFGERPGSAALEARLVMPEEMAGTFAPRHLVAPIELSTARDQSAMAYIVAGTSEAAAFFDSAADDSSDEEQQTIVLASTVLGQVLQALNSRVFGSSPAGLVLSIDDMIANSMDAVLGTIDEPCVALDFTITARQPLTLSLVLPGTFLDIVAGALPAAAAAEADTPDAGSLFSEDDLNAAELVEPEPVPVAAARPAPVASASLPDPAPAQREPTPISQAPAASRARFAPLPEPKPAISQQQMDLLAGLQMNVTVELGRTDLTVSEVLGLGPGSVIELERIAGEPVDILVNDRIIARGEVVVVDENFGVRVVEVIRRPADTEERAS